MWTKHTNYEQANRIPIVIAAPGVSKAGSSSSALIESVDIFPTLADLAGLPAPRGPQPIDGDSFRDVLDGSRAQITDHAYHCYPKAGKLGRAIRTERYRMVEWMPFGGPPSAAEFELYDYRDDPQETKNLAAERPEVLAELKLVLAKHPPAKPRQRKRPLSKPGKKIVAQEQRPSKEKE